MALPDNKQVSAIAVVILVFVSFIVFSKRVVVCSSLVNKNYMADLGRQYGNLEVNCGEKMEITLLINLST
jgi:hypothetical protein